MLQQLLHGRWAIDFDYARQLGPFVYDLLHRNNSRESFMDFFNMSAQNGPRYNLGKKETVVAVLSIKGVMTKEDQFCGPRGTCSIREEILKIQNQIDGLVLEIDTPGGQVDGTEELASTIASLDMPVNAHVSDTTASAGYWLASQADNIFLSGKTAMVGSIGTIISFMDVQPYWEKEFGIKFHEIRASKSTRKGEELHDARQGKYKKMRSNLLDPTNDVFINTVREGRKDKDLDESVFEAGIYIGDSAIKAGLADGYKSLRETIQFTQTKIEEYESSTN